MSGQSRRVLQEMRLVITDNIYSVGPILDHLYSYETITADMMEEVKAKGTRSGQIGTLLDILERRGSKALEHFCKALESTSNGHLAAALRDHMKSEPVVAQEEGIVFSSHYSFS